MPVDLSRYGADAQARGYNTYQEAQAYNTAKRRGQVLTGAVLPIAGVAGGLAAPALFGGGSAAAGGGSAAGGGAAGGGMGMSNGALNLTGILASVFGNLFGAHQQSKTAERTTQMQIDASSRAAELEKQAIDEALAYQKEIDARDYKDWLAQDLRDRRDWEAKEQRRAPYRALGDSAIRTLADYIRVPGMQPAQEVPVQIWNPNQSANGTSSASSRMPTSNTMPVGGGGGGGGGNVESLTSAYLAQHPEAKPGSFKDFLEGYTPYMAEQGYNVQFMEHPTKFDKVTITGKDGRSQVIDMVVGAGGDNPQWGYQVEGGGSGGSGGSGGGTASASGGGWRNSAPTTTLLSKYSRPRTLLDLASA